MPNYPYAAILFDMDGTLIDNVPLHQAVWHEFTSRYSLHLSDHQLDFAKGRKALEVIEHFWPSADAAEIKRLTDERQNLYRTRLADSDLVRVVSGAEQFLQFLVKIGIPRVLATDAPRANVDAVFKKFPLAGYFNAVITSDNVRYGKPHPDIFLAAAEAAGAAPAQCLVAEDSLAGVQAAKAAGCTCLAITTTQTAAELRSERADYIAADFCSLPKEFAAD